MGQTFEGHFITTVTQILKNKDFFLLLAQLDQPFRFLFTIFTEPATKIYIYIFTYKRIECVFQNEIILNGILTIHLRM